MDVKVLNHGELAHLHIPGTRGSMLDPFFRIRTYSAFPTQNTASEAAQLSVIIEISVSSRVKRLIKARVAWDVAPQRLQGIGTDLGKSL